MNDINFFLNGQSFKIKNHSNILDLIQKLELEPRKIAIEMDENIILNNEYQKIFITENCKIEIVHFIGGG
ncbi:MAG: sulfur carrier protein ThiS [Alphaproteobacteria bacterium]